MKTLSVLVWTEGLNELNVCFFKRKRISVGSLKHFVQFSIFKYCNVYSQFVIT